MMRAVLCAFSVAAVALSGCTVSTHNYKHVYWTKKPDVSPLPPADILAAPGYVSYPLLIERKKLFQAVSENCDDYPLDIKVKTTVENALNPFLAIPWILLSGSSVFIIPYKAEFDVTAEFTVAYQGKDLKSYRYTDTKTTWTTILAFATLGEKTDEYYIEELMADQFVNSFIVDLLADKKIMAQIRPKPTKASRPASTPKIETKPVLSPTAAPPPTDNPVSVLP